MLRMIVLLVLGAHGIGHLIGVVGGWGGSAWGGSAESWIVSPVLGRWTGAVGGGLWLLPTVGFLVATGLLLSSNELWRGVAVLSAIASLVVITAFPEQLPIGSVVGAVLVNAAVLIGLLVAGWPSAETVGA